MAAEVVVICVQCGRPQKASGGSCAHCGTALPATRERSARDQLVDAFTPSFETELGGGRKLLLSEKRLEWVAPVGGFTVNLSELDSVRLAQRPVYESLIFSALALVAAVFLGTGPRIALSVLFTFGVAACFLQKRYTLVLTRKSGQSAQILWGIARGAVGERLCSVYGSVAAELKQRGVR
ncbi:MAG: hypothetical protein ACT4TC_04925 [Myxococcaceae bacterium]